uniref:Dynein regulatory complex protein 1 C-terminal domain-containing protein n=1 Tax=Tenebrio molitor TaxID=7067 RepID=A0A8J6L681_TENMO|nr:hypothetical protein GEV33_014899 [Tenebrio molitor]
MDEEDIEGFWEEYTKMFPKEREKLWSYLVDGLKRYHELLKAATISGWVLWSVFSFLPVRPIKFLAGNNPQERSSIEERHYSRATSQYNKCSASRLKKYVAAARIFGGLGAPPGEMWSRWNAGKAPGDLVASLPRPSAGSGTPVALLTPSRFGYWVSLPDNLVSSQCLRRNADDGSKPPDQSTNLAENNNLITFLADIQHRGPPATIVNHIGSFSMESPPCYASATELPVSADRSIHEISSIVAGRDGGKRQCKYGRGKCNARWLVVGFVV